LVSLQDSLDFLLINGKYFGCFLHKVGWFLFIEKMTINMVERGGKGLVLWIFRSLSISKRKGEFGMML
jgi:hypothetical protein